MRKHSLFALGLFALLFLFVGCGGSSSSDTPVQANIAPSAADFPYGVESMVMPYDDNTVTLDFAYDTQGRLIEISAAVEIDSNEDGRTDYIQTITYTIDPTIPVTDISEFDDIFMVPMSKSMARSAPMGISMSSSVMSELPGGVVRIELEEHSYNISAEGVDIPDDMVLTEHMTVDYEYDADGRVTQAVATNETDDAIITMTYTFSYDDGGHLLSMKAVGRYDRYKDGWIDDAYIEELIYTYDAAGNKISMVEDDYASDYIKTTTYTYDDAGLLSGEEYKRTQRGSGDLYNRSTVTYTYDTSGRLTKEVRNVYSVDLDGYETLTSVTTTTYSYTDDGRLSEKVREEDGDADSTTANTIYTDTYTYGPYGLTTYSYTYDYGSGAYTYVYDYTYNAQGQITTQQRSNDNDNDGVADYFYIQTFTYDEAGRLLSVEDADYPAVSGAPGDVAYKNVTTFTYDAGGRLTQTVYEYMSNGIDVDRRMIVTAEYNEADTSASGTVTVLQRDETTGELVPDGAAKPVSFSFAAGAPTATMASTLKQFPYNNYDDAKDFEKIEMSIDIPALYGLYYGAASFSYGSK